MTTYSISLDDVDVALLPLRTHKYNDFLKKEHYQFQVMKNKEEEEHEPTIFYKCHICATDVPAAFAREHAASIKHRANARIASVAAVRTRALITAPSPAAAQTSRFCANCSTTVGGDHEKTKEHRVAVMHDKLLWELMMAYVGDDDGLSDSTSDDDKENDRDRNGLSGSEVNNKEDKKSQAKLSLTSSEDSILNRNTDKEDLLDNKTKTNEAQTSDNDTDKYPATATQAAEINDTANVIGTKNDQDTHTKVPVRLEYVEFVTKHNKTVKVFSDYYHSFTRKGDTVNCKVCSSVFSSNQVDSHMFSLNHLNKMPSAMIDQHCVRKIDDAYSHCILCNAMIKNNNLSKHYLTVGHSKMERALVTENPNNQSTFNNTTPESEVTTDNSSRTTPDMEVKSQTEKSIVDWPVIYPYEETENGVRCVICECEVTNTPENRKSHLVGLSHVQNVKKRRETQSPKLKYPYVATQKANFARCMICDIHLTISTICLKEHMDGQSHIKNVNKKMATVQKEFVVTEPASVASCLTCNIKVPNTLRNLLDHLSGSKHIKEANKRVSTSVNSLTSE